MTTTSKINSFFKLTIAENASDLHLMTDQPPILRIDGQLLPVKSKKLTKTEVSGLVYDILSQSQRKEFEEKKNLDFSYEVPGVGRFRIDIFIEKGNLAMAARAIPTKIPTMEEILMPESTYDLLNQDRGLILVTGPAGSGKSTTLAAMINHINNNQSSHILTLEDPIEFIFESSKSYIAQRELGRDMRTFAEGLRHVLRQDPNILMVGEMRDPETIAAALTLAETGHLVMATLHTQNAAQTIERIIDSFPPHQQNQIKAQLSMTLKAVIAQRLLPGKKSGRVASREIMLNSIAVANLIRDNKIEQVGSVIQTSAKEGMVSLDRDLKRLHKEGLIDRATANRYLSRSLAIQETPTKKKKNGLFGKK